MDDEAPLLAGHMSFTALLALFPFLIFLVSLAGFLGDRDSARALVDNMFRFMPADVASTLAPAVDEVLSERSGGLLTFGIIAALWIASGGVEALRTALNRAYSVSDLRPIWWRRLQSLAFVVAGGLAFFLLSVFIILGPALWELLNALAPLPPELRLLWDAGRYLFATVVLIATQVILHRWLPNKPLRWRQLLPGTILSTVAWIVGASLFSFYLTTFARYNVTYGSLGGIVITMMFFYLSALIFILGAELNADLMQSRAKARDKADA